MISNSKPIRWKTITVQTEKGLTIFELDDNERLITKFKREKKRSVLEKTVISNLLFMKKDYLQNQQKKQKLVIEEQIILPNEILDANSNGNECQMLNSYHINSFYLDSPINEFMDDSELNDEWFKLEEKYKIEEAFFFS